MNIVVLGNEDQKLELAGEKSNASVVWVEYPETMRDLRGMDACIDLLFDQSKERTVFLKQMAAGIIIINAVIHPLNESTNAFIRFNGWNGFLKRPIAEAAGSDPLSKDKAENIFSFLGKKTEWVPDVPGLISSRIIASVINEAYFTLEESVSTKEEIDIAMKLGTNYPYGPFEWCIKIGIKNVFDLLTVLAKDEKRYEPSALLSREALM